MKLKLETKLTIAAIAIPALVTLVALAPFPQGLKVIGGILFQERADHSQTPAAGFGEFWVKNDTPNKPMFTNDAGTDIDLSAGGGGAVDSVNGLTGTVVLDPDDLDDTATDNKFTTAADISKLDGIETGATADQSDAEIETAYNNQVSVVSQAEAEAGTATTPRRWTAQRVGQAIAALGGTGGGDPTYGSDAGAADDAVYVDADNQMGIGTTAPSSSIHLYDQTLPPTVAYQFFSETGGDVTAFAGTGTGMSDGAGGVWNNPSNVSANDGNFTQTINLFTENAASHSFIATNYSFAIPTGANIDGVEVDVEVWAGDELTEDYVVKLVIGGVVQEVNRATGALLGSTPAVKTYGGPLDTWSEALTPEIINASDFGVSWQGWYVADGTSIAIDYITITIYYTELGGDHHWVTGLSLATGGFVFRENATDHVSIAKTTGDTTFLGDVTAAAFIGDGSGLTGLPGGMTGPVSSTDNAIPRFDGAGGDTLQNSEVTIGDTGNITVGSGDTVDGRDVSADGTKLDGIETGATADQTDAEIETAYNNQVSVVSQAEAEAGTSTTPRRWTAQRVGQAIAALGGTGGGDVSGPVASTTTNMIPVYVGTAGEEIGTSQLQILGDDISSISGTITVNGHPIHADTDSIVTTNAAQTLNNKDVAHRELTDSTTPVDVNATNYDSVVTVMSANTTFNAPTSPPRNGKRLLYAIKQGAGPYTDTWDSVFVSPASWGIPSNAIPDVSTTNGTWDYYLFIWNSDMAKWVLLSTTAPLL